MWFDDLELVRAATEKYPPPPGPIVDAGGLIRPCVANYAKTIKAMKIFRGRTFSDEKEASEALRAAQGCRYENIERPLSFLGPYAVENPELGGLSIRDLKTKYDHTIGCLVCLSTLEHVDEPWMADEDFHAAMRPGGLLIISVPWIFPHHAQGGSGEDNWRFSPTGLRRIFEGELFECLEAGFRLRIGADEGVLDIHTGRPQAIESAYLIGRAR